MVTITLCICTFRRPDGLKRLLTSVAALETDTALSVVVVDNDDRLGEGQALCERLAPDYRWPLAALVEGRPGISYARNTAIAAALEQKPDFIAMLDDDEWPTPGWLRALLAVQADTEADVVAGPVLPEFASVPPPWMRREGLFGTAQQVDRSEGVFYASGNFMAKRACFETMMPTPFDPDFALSGGEDLVFFRNLAKHGYRMVWAADAHVREIVPGDRMTVAWLKQRQQRRGNLNVIVQRRFAPGAASELIRLAKTAGLTCIAGCWYLVTWPFPVARTRPMLLLHVALGKIKAHLGLRYFEYKRDQVHQPAAAPASSSGV
jgi:hypothetical protein